MKIDLSSIFLVVLLVIPGLFAQRAKGLIVPPPLVEKGASEELAELVALGLGTHGLLVFLMACLALIAAILRHHELYYFFYQVDSWHPQTWSAGHASGAILLVTSYVFISFVVGHLLGLFNGTLSVQGGVTAWVFRRAKWLRTLGVRGLLGERPIIYDLLNAEVNADGIAKKLFVEVELKGELGFYSGQVSQFAIVRDEEPHKPLYLIDPWYKQERTAEYLSLPADGVLLDLADVAVLLVRQVDITLSLDPKA